MAHLFSAGVVFATLGILVTAAPELAAQDPGRRGQAAAHAVIDFSELARQEASKPQKPRDHEAIPFMPVPDPTSVPLTGARKKDTTAPSTKLAFHPADLGLPTPAMPPSPAPVANFEALADDNTKVPPGTMGAVGPAHLMVMLNSQVRIQDRSGVQVSIMSLDTFWAATGATGVFQPHVVYDPYNDRWIVAAVSGRSSANSSVLVGASQSGNPAGLWNLYKFDADATDINWADSPLLGFNMNWVVVSVNRFTIAGTPQSFVDANIYAFDKADIYGAQPSPLVTVFTDVFGAAPFPAVTYDNALATMFMARVWSTNVEGDPGEFAGSLRIATITGSVDFPSYTYDGPEVSSPPTPWAFAPATENFASQSGTTDKISNGDSRLLNLVYRNGSLWAAHNAFLPANSPTRTAAQWWQFSTTGTLQQFGRVENTTGPVFYAYPTIAVNSQNDVLLGFSVFSASQFAAAGYAVRNAADAPGTLRTPVILKAGETSYFKVFSGTRNRWGDYSATLVDPLNNLDFWTIQEYADSPQFSPPNYGRWGTWWGKVIPPPPFKRTRQLVAD